MTELETKLVALLKASEAESKQREQRLLESVESLRQQVQQLADQQNELIERYNQVAELLAEELRQ